MKSKNSRSGQKLSELQVKVIKSLYRMRSWPYDWIASKFGISENTISNIVYEVTWKSVQPDTDWLKNELLKNNNFIEEVGKLTKGWDGNPKLPKYQELQQHKLFEFPDSSVNHINITECNTIH